MFTWPSKWSGGTIHSPMVRAGAFTHKPSVISTMIDVWQIQIDIWLQIWCFNTCILQILGGVPLTKIKFIGQQIPLTLSKVKQNHFSPPSRLYTSFTQTAYRKTWSYLNSLFKCILHVFRRQFDILQFRSCLPIFTNKAHY